MKPEPWIPEAWVTPPDPPPVFHPLHVARDMTVVIKTKGIAEPYHYRNQRNCRSLPLQFHSAFRVDAVNLFP